MPALPVGPGGLKEPGVKTIFSTDEVHPRDRFDYWHDVACRTIVAHDSTPASRLAFHAQVRAGALAEIGLVEFDADGFHFSRGARHAESDDLLVCRQIAGSMTLEQCGREIVLGPGSFMLLDPRVPYSGSFISPASLLALRVPRPLLESRLGRAPQVMSVSVAPVQGEAALTSSILAMLPEIAAGLAKGAADPLPLNPSSFLLPFSPFTRRRRRRPSTRARGGGVAAAAARAEENSGAAEGHLGRARARR